MQAIEFETFVSGGLIKIPSNFRSFDNIKAKVILLFPFETYKSNFNKEKLQNVFKKAQAKKVFKSMADSIRWQKQLRDEWE